MTMTVSTATRIAAAALVLAAATGPAATPAGAQTPIALEHRATFHEAFGFLQAVRELSDGRILVADPLGGLLVAIDLDTGAMDPVGREGGGPGEWRQPDAVLPLPGDSTLVVDLGNTRLSVYGPDGGFVRSHPMVLAQEERAEARRGSDPAEAARAGLRMATQIMNPRATDAAGRIYYQSRGGMALGGGLDSLEVMRWDRDDAPAVRLAGLRPPASTATTSGATGQAQVRVMARPLAAQDDWAVAPDGRVALIRAEPYRVEWLHPDGRVARGEAVDYRPLPVRTREKQRWLDAQSAGALTVAMTMDGGSMTTRMGRGGGGGPGPAAARGMDDYEWPDVMPPFRPGGARVDPNGRVWVERYNAVGTPVLYDVFDRRGARVAQVALPDGLRVIGFGRSAVYAARVDDLGLHWLEVFAPPR